MMSFHVLTQKRISCFMDMYMFQTLVCTIFFHGRSHDADTHVSKETRNSLVVHIFKNKMNYETVFGVTVKHQQTRGQSVNQVKIIKVVNFCYIICPSNKSVKRFQCVKLGFFSLKGIMFPQKQRCVSQQVIVSPG
jgi:hypothetical protein